MVTWCTSWQHQNDERAARKCFYLLIIDKRLVRALLASLHWFLSIMIHFIIYFCYHSFFTQSSSSWLPFLLKWNLRNISQKIYKKNIYKWYLHWCNVNQNMQQHFFVVSLNTRSKMFCTFHIFSDKTFHLSNIISDYTKH